VFRTAVLGSGERLPGPVHVRSNLVYDPDSQPSTDVNGPLRHIQKAMRLAEATLARDLCRDDTLMIVDGPLSFEQQRRGIALGYIKRIPELPAKFIPLLAALPAGTRTPIFGIRSAKSGFARYSWFQRLAEPGLGAIDMKLRRTLGSTSRAGWPMRRPSGCHVLPRRGREIRVQGSGSQSCPPSAFRKCPGKPRSNGATRGISPLT
jgi:hypothetical protein